MESQPTWYALIGTDYERYRLAADRVSALNEVAFIMSLTNCQCCGRDYSGDECLRADCLGYDENGSDRDYDYYVNFPDGRTELHNTRTDNDRDYTENALTDYITNEDHPEDSDAYGPR